MLTLMLSLVQMIWLRMSITLVFSSTILIFYVKGLQQCSPGSRMSLNLPNYSLKPRLEVGTFLYVQQQHPQMFPKQVMQFLQRSQRSAIQGQVQLKIIDKRLLFIRSENIMKTNRDYSPNTSINSQPKSLTLSIEQFSPRATFKTSFPTKKFSEICKKRKESISSFCKYKYRKCSQSQKGTLDVDVRNLKDILNKKIIKAVFQDQKLQTPKTPKLPFKHKFKYQMMRGVQSHRTNPTTSLDLTAQSANLVPKRAKCLVINTEPSLSQQEQIALAKSPQLLIRTSNGSSKKVDSYMYLRKIKTKKQSFTQVRGQSALKESTNRQLYILKENNLKKKSFLNSFYGLKPQQIKSKQRRRMVTQKQEYRPWSAGRSEASVE